MAKLIINTGSAPNDGAGDSLRDGADKINANFTEIYGAPTRKQDAIRNTLLARGIDPNESLMIGDAQADLDAAVANQVPFLLRRHSSNNKVFSTYTGASVEDFTTL